MLFHNWCPATTKPCFKWQSPTRTGILHPIPLEIYTEIFSYLTPSQDDAFSDKERMKCFSSLMGVCKFFAAVARPVIWSSAPFCVAALMTTEFATSVAKAEPRSVPLAGWIKKLTIGDPILDDWRNCDSFLEEDGFGGTLATALARMPVEELTITMVVITKKVLKLIKVVAPRLKVLKITEDVSISNEVSHDELKAVFGAMRGLEELNVVGRNAQCRLTQSPSHMSPCLIPVSNLRRLCTDALFTIDSCIDQGAPLTHLEIDGMHVSWQDTQFLYTRLKSFPSLTHILIHDVINADVGRFPMDIPVGDSLPKLISFKAPPGLLPRFHSLGPRLQVLDSTGTNNEEPYADSSHPFLDPSGDDFTTTNIRELVVFDCNLNSPWVVPPVEKPVPNLRLMRVIYTGTVNHWSNAYTVPKMFEELGTMCEDRTPRFPVEELVITFDEGYFTRDVGKSSRDCSWVVDLKRQLEMIEGLADGLPKLKRVLYHGGFVAWMRRIEGSGSRGC